MTTSERSRGFDPTILLWLIVFIPLGLTLFASLGDLPARDGAIFTYVGEGLFAGEAPYADRWDHKPPLIFVVSGLGRLLTPQSFLGIQLLEMLSIAAWMLLGYLALRPAFGVHASLFSLALVLAAMNLVLGRGNYTEEWALLPQFAAIFLFARLRGSSVRTPASILAVVAIGGVGAAAFLFRANLIGVWLAIGLVWLIWDSARWRKLGWSIVGGVGTLAVAAILIGAGGFFAEFIDAAFVFNSVYSDTGGLAGWLSNIPVTWSAMAFSVPATLVWLGALAYVTWRHKATGPTVTLLRLAVVLAPIELALMAMSGRDYLHYFLTMLPVLSILAAFVGLVIVKLVAQALDRIRPGRSHGAGRVGASLVPVVVLLLLTTPVALSYAIEPGLRSPSADTQRRDRRILDTAERIEELTAADDAILVWGAEPQLHLITGRDSPTRFFFQHPLVFEGYSSTELIDEFMADLSEDPPSLIIDTRNVRLPPLDPERRVGWKTATPGYEAPPGALDGFFELVERDYEPLERIDRFTIYQRTAD